jgi:lipoate-protein ligase A
MGVMDTMMDMMIKTISKEKREQMMINMMPQMMEGIDIYEFMPKMMTDMLKDVTVDDVIAFIKRAIEEQDKLKELTDKITQANLMQQMMFKVYQSKLGFD